MAPGYRASGAVSIQCFVSSTFGGRRFPYRPKATVPSPGICGLPGGRRRDSLAGVCDAIAVRGRSIGGDGGTGAMREVLRQLIGALEGGREQLICQVVETRGSTPQKAGALMVVDPDGGQAGTLGGGCVEAEVKQKAIRRIGQAGAELHAFVLDHDYAWADGLICGGKMVIVAEAVRGPGPLAYFRAYRTLLEAGDGFTEAVVVDPERAGAELGARFLFDHEGAVAALLAGARRPRGARRAGRPPVRPAPAGRPGGRRAAADPAARPAGDRRSGARRAGGRRAGRASRLRRLGRRRPPPVRQRRAVPRRPAVGRGADRPGPARAWRSRRGPTS